MLSFSELLEKRLRRVKLEGERRFADSDGGGLLVHLLALEISLQGIEKETIMGYAVPVEDLLLLLCADAVVLVKKIEEGTLGLFQRGIGARFEIAQIGKDTFFKLLRVLDWATKGLEAEGKASYNVGARDVEEVVPRSPLEPENRLLPERYSP